MRLINHRNLTLLQMQSIDSLRQSFKKYKGIDKTLYSGERDGCWLRKYFYFLKCYPTYTMFGGLVCFWCSACLFGLFGFFGGLYFKIILTEVITGGKPKTKNKNHSMSKSTGLGFAKLSTLLPELCQCAYCFNVLLCCPQAPPASLQPSYRNCSHPLVHSICILQHLLQI